MIINTKKVWQLSWPVILANFSIPLVGLTDTFIMGHMPSSKYLASVAIGGIIFNFVYAGFNFLRMGTTGIVSQEYGKKNKQEVLFGLLRPIIIAIICGITLNIFKEVIFDLSNYFFQLSQNIKELYKNYLFVRMVGLPFGLLNIVMLGWFFGIQKTKFVMLQLFIINISNIFFSYYFSVILDYGITGVAFGSVISQVIGSFFSIFLLFRIKTYLNVSKLDFSNLFLFKKVLRIFFISKDLFIRTIFLVFAQAFLIKKSGLIGVNELASMEILLVIFSVCSYSLDAFAHSAETLVGYSIGSKNRRSLKKSINITSEMALIFSLLISLILIFFEEIIIYSVTDIEKLRLLIQDLWFFVIITPPISVFAFQFDGIFIGATLVKEMRNSIVISCIFFYIIIEFVFGEFISLSNLYFCFLLFLIFRGVVLFLYFNKIYKLVGK